MNMNMNNLSQMGPMNFNNQLEHPNHIITNGGIQQYLNAMMGEPHLTPANSHEINRLEKINVVKECPICQ